MRKRIGRIPRVTAAAATLAAVLLLAPASARAQGQSSKQSANAAGVAVQDSTTSETPTAVAEGAKPAENLKTAVAPAFRDYKGVKIGMSADEVRRLLGSPKEKGKDQDFFAYSERETAQVFYDSAGKATAVAVSFYGAKSGAPSPADVLGKNVEAKEDGSLYQRERYADAGYWVSYSRTAGDAPLVTITVQKIP